MLISEIILHNFQIHKDLHIKLQPGVNVILGDTDAGKSAIIRALKLILDNQPRSGESIFQNKHNKDPLSIEIVHANGSRVKREKRRYYLNGELLKAFGTDTLAPIKELFPLKDINWQRQLEPHFLVLQTGGGATKLLNASTGMEDQELLIKEVKTKITESKSNIKRISKNNEEHKETIDRLQNVNRFMDDALYIKAEIDQYYDLTNTNKELRIILDKIYQCRKNRINIKIINDRLKDITTIESGIKSIKGKKAIIAGLQDLLNHLKEAQIEVHNKRIYNKRLHSINLIIEKHNQFFKTTSIIKQLFKLIQQIQQIKKDKIAAKKEYKRLEKKLNNYLLELGYCPTCGRSITEEHKC